MKNFVNNRLALDEIAFQNAIRESGLASGSLFKLRNNNNLIIGIGGTGVRYAAGIKKLLYKRYNKTQLARRVKFLIIDSDKDTETNSVKTGIFDEREWFWLGNEPMQRFVRNGYPEHIKDWLNTEVRAEKVCDSKGAGGVRMAGRALLLSNIDQLRNKVYEILAGFRDDQAGIAETNIFVVSGLAGGTGSGAFIDTSFLVHHIFRENRLALAQFKVFGLFELPDSTVNDNNITDELGRNRAYGNGYAALKEIDYFFKKSMYDGLPPYKVWYINDRQPFEFPEALYKAVLLFSREGTDIKNQVGFVKNPVPTDFNENPPKYLDNAVPEIVNLMIGKPIIGEDQRDFDLFSSLCNDGGICSMGVSKLEVPVDKIIVCVVSRLFFELETYWKTKPTDDEINEMYDFIGAASLKKKISGYLISILEDLDDSELKSSALDEVIREKLEKKITRGISNTQWSADYRTKIRDLYSQKGPWHVIVLKNCCDKKVQEFLNKEKSNGESFAKALENFKNAGFFNKKSLRQDFINAAISYYGDYLILAEVGKQAEARLNVMNDINNDIYDPVTKMFEAFSRILEDIVGFKTPTVRQNYGNFQAFSWDLSDVSYQKINSKMADMFVRRLVFSDGNSIDITENIYHTTKDGRRGCPLFNKTSPDKSFDVITESNKSYQNVKSVTSYINLFQGQDDKKIEINFETITKKLLEDVLEHLHRDDKDILDLVFDCIKNVINTIKNIAFENMLLMLDKDSNFTTTKKLDPETKDKRLKEALKNFFQYSLPCFPLDPTRLTAENKYELLIKPVTNANIDAILGATRNIQGGNAGMRVIEHSSVLLNIVLYKRLSLSYYNYLSLCKAGYEYKRTHIDENGVKLWPGTHLSEGTDREYDWRTFLPEISAPNTNKAV
jgi:hypothetical protein